MSEEDLSNTDEGLDGSKLDASMTVDSSSLSSAEADFARPLGFGIDEDDNSEPDPTPSASDAEPIVETPSPASNEVPEDTNDAEDVDDDQETKETVSESSDEKAEAAKADNPGNAKNPDLEEMHPSASAAAMQSILEARADELLGRDAIDPSRIRSDCGQSSKIGTPISPPFTVRST